jgi:hypothetical protein
MPRIVDQNAHQHQGIVLDIGGSRVRRREQFPEKMGGFTRGIGA